MAVKDTIGRTCPTCLPDAVGDFDRVSTDYDAESYPTRSTYRCRNCRHERIVRHRRPGPELTPAQERIVAGVREVSGDREVRVRKVGRDALVFVYGVFPYSQTVEAVVGPRGRLEVTVMTRGDSPDIVRRGRDARYTLNVYAAGRD